MTLRDILAFIIAIFTGYQTGIIMIESYILIFAWIMFGPLFSLIVCAVAKRQRILAGIVFNSAITVTLLKIIAHRRELRGLGFSLGEDDIYLLLGLWIIGALISTGIAYVFNITEKPKTIKIDD